jgi:Rrf2 family transcriptional regulator, nitric oxide-sensitive transcriptional repressor
LKFRLQTDYALRALTYLAAKGGPATTDEIAGHFGISSAHLGRVIRRLQAIGYMKAVRGRKGGVRIARDPQTLTLGEVTSKLEDDNQSVDGLKNGHVASPAAERLSHTLKRANAMFNAYLGRVTFADLAQGGADASGIDMPLSNEAFVFAEKLATGGAPVEVG